MGTCGFGFGRLSRSGVRPGRGHMQEAPAGHTRPVGGFKTLANGSCPFRRRRVWRPALPLSTRIASKLVGPPPVPGGSTASSDLAVVASSTEFESALSASGALRLPRLDQAGFPSGVSPFRDLSESTDGFRLDPRGPRFPPPDFHYSPRPLEMQELFFGKLSRGLQVVASAAISTSGARTDARRSRRWCRRCRTTVWGTLRHRIRWTPGLLHAMAWPILNEDDPTSCGVPYMTIHVT